MKRIWLILAIIPSLFILFVPTVLAICPICTVTVAVGVGLSRWLGIDDTIAGLWIGGLTVSLIMWTINWLEKKNVKFKGRNFTIFIGYFALIVLPLQFTNILGHPLNRLWGMDKLLLGIILGSIVFYANGAWYQILKQKNAGRAYFPFQKIVMPVAPLILLSIIFYFVTR